MPSCKGQLRGKCAMVLLRLCREGAGGARRTLECDIRCAQLEKIDGRRFRKISVGLKRHCGNGPGALTRRRRSGGPRARRRSSDAAGAA